MLVHMCLECMKVKIDKAWVLKQPMKPIVREGPRPREVEEVYKEGFQRSLLPIKVRVSHAKRSQANNTLYALAVDEMDREKREKQVVEKSGNEHGAAIVEEGGMTFSLLIDGILS